MLNQHQRKPADVIRLFQLLRNDDQLQIIKTMQRPGVLACLPAINQVFDKLEAKPNPVI